jgi:putative FmdB family regulatory protein
VNERVAAAPGLHDNRPQEGPTAMPIFEYTCQDCARPFEALVRSDTVPACPHCHSTRLEKQLSVFATASSTPQAAAMPAMAGPCGQCGHPDGPGSCALH